MELSNVTPSEEKSTTKTEMTNEEISVLSAEKKIKILIKRKILIRTYTRFTVSKEG